MAPLRVGHRQGESGRGRVFQIDHPGNSYYLVFPQSGNNPLFVSVGETGANVGTTVTKLDLLGREIGYWDESGTATTTIYDTGRAGHLNNHRQSRDLDQQRGHL